MSFVDVTKFRAGEWKTHLEYRYFMPNEICKPWTLEHPQLQEKMSRVDRFLGRLDAFSDLIPDSDFFLQMYVAKEATQSSRIEGTQTNIEEAFMNEIDLDPERRDDWQEVANYIKAMNFAIGKLEATPISNRLIRDTHKLLLHGVRGKHKLPGEFRKSQNWIGGTLKNATFVPPSQEHVPPLMGDLEQLVNSENLPKPFRVIPLIKTAIAHYQFETIHPFLDGNGRMGRLLITLMMVDAGVLKRPTLYLSDFFEQYRREYYRLLMQCRTENDMVAWIEFFLDGVEQTARDAINTMLEVIDLRKKLDEEILPKLGRKQKEAQKLVNVLYRDPVITAAEIAQVLDVHTSTATRLIKDLEKYEILHNRTDFKRNRIFVFEPYMALFR